jgi:CzcA family heavy metal efflux pump
MMRWIIETSLRLRNLLLFASVALIAFGATQFRGMPIDVYPEFAPPRVEVQVLCLGMTASDVESLVTVPMEEALNGLKGLDVIRSRSVPDLSDIVLYFKPGTDLWEARLLVQERVRSVTEELPVWATSPYMIQPLSSTSRVMKIGFSVKDRSTQNLIDTALTAYWTVRPRLMRVPGVANVAIWGDRWSVLQVQADPERMQKHRVSLNNIMDTTADALDIGMLKFRAGHEIGTGGFIDTPNQRLGIRHVLPSLHPEELAKVPVSKADGEHVALGEVAHIERGIQPMFNGDAVINDDVGLMMIVEKLPWGNTLEVTRGVEAALEQMKPGLPGIEIDTQIFRPATFIEDSLHNLSLAMISGFVLITVVLLLFLYEWRVALISLLTIPLSVIAAGLVLKATGETINTMVLAGLVIALGIIVDDAIIDIENIVRRLRQHRAQGGTESAAKIILDASLEVRAPIMHATLIILATTVPIFLLQGLAGSFFRPLGFAYATAILASMVIAMTVTPALALIMLARAPLERRRESPVKLWLVARYEALLARIIQRPGSAYATVGVVTAAGLMVVPFLGQGLFPKFKERDFLMHWVARPGTSHAEMLRISILGGKELLTVPGVRNFGTHTGQGTLADEPVGMNFAENWISIDRNVDYDKTLAKVEEIVDGYPGLYRDVQTYLKERTKEVLTGTGHGIVVRVSGDDLNILRDKAFELKKLISELPEVGKVHVELVNDIPQLQVEVDLAAAFRHGIKPGDVRRAISTFIASEEAGDIWRDGKNHEVHVWSARKYRNSIKSVGDLTMEGQNGEPVRLAELAKIEMRPTPNVVLRENVSRRIDVFLDVPENKLGTVAEQIEKLITKVEFPLGYHAELLGEFRERQTAAQRLKIASIGSLLAILIIMQTAFGSWRLAILVMLTLPIALVGGFLGTALDDRTVSLGTLVGLLTVMGIAARNGIMLINHCQHLERFEGEAFGPKLVLRGAKERLSPILMTSLAAGLGVLPLVVAGTVPGNEIEHPMAVVILGGLVTSTLLSLFVLPSLYLRFGKSQAAGASGNFGPLGQPVTQS